MDIFAHLARQEATELQRLRDVYPPGSAALTEAERRLKREFEAKREPFIKLLVDAALRLPPDALLLPAFPRLPVDLPIRKLSPG